VKDVLDQTRIHPSNYVVAQKLALDAVGHRDGGDENDKLSKATAKVFENPQKLDELDLKTYAEQLGEA
jgi:transcriptional accessory protein Tex/SPT6